jgi:uncharacterized protein YxjI
MADGYSICTKCSWINKVEDLSCNACGASLPRSSTPFVPTASTTATAVQPPFQPSYPVTVNPSVFVPSQTNSYSTRPQQSSTYSYAPTSPTRPSTMQSYTDQNASSNSYSSPTRPYVATPSNAQAFYPQPSAPCEPNSNADFGSKQSSVPVATSNYPPTGSYVPSNVNSTTHAHHETSTFVNSAAPVNRPSEPVDDFASGFGKGTSYNSGVRPQSNNVLPTQVTPITVPSKPLASVPSPNTASVYRIREKFWGFADNFTIEDSNRQPCYKVKGKVFAIGDQLSFQNLNGKEVAAISQQCLNFLPTYKIKQNGRVVAELQKEFTLMTQKFALRVNNVDNYSIKGNFFQHDFSFTKQGREVARANKQLLSFSDSYGVKVMPGEDAVIILCACIIIDQILHDN